MNEAETRAELIDPKLKESGWGVLPNTKILREFPIAPGRILGQSPRKPEKADYVLVLNNKKVAVIEAKAAGQDTEKEAVTQAKTYAQKLDIEFTYATNGQKIYEMNMRTGKEWYLDRFPTPEELSNALDTKKNALKKAFDDIPFEDVNGSKGARYYQEIAIQKTTDAIAEDKNRILLTLATGTGKTFIAFQIAWKLFHARWNIQKENNRRPRILFLADRNILANQAFNSFGSFPEDALVRIKPSEIKKKGTVPTNGSIFFTIFQTFLSGPQDTPYFGDYPADFFDVIIIDECHRGGAKDESQWRTILEYFDSAVHIGLTATPKREGNIDTYRYFGNPVYTYSLKEGINDGFLTPFKVERIQTTIDDYIYTKDDEVVEGEVEEGKIYTESDFNKIIEIEAREEKRVKILLSEMDQNEKTLVFCANQAHAALIRDLINRNKKNPDPFYCVRVTANDGARGEQYLDHFKDNERTIPTILTTSQKLSTGVDALNIRNIALLRPVNSMIEFKQIIGRGTRLFDGKEHFTIYDFVNAYKLFADPAWDGDPIEEVTNQGPAHEGIDKQTTIISDPSDVINDAPRKVKIKLRDGKERDIGHMKSTSFWSADGKPLSITEFMNNLYLDLSELVTEENQLKTIWGNPTTRYTLLQRLSDKGYGFSQLDSIQKSMQGEQSDLLDIFIFLLFRRPTSTREQRVSERKESLLHGKAENERDFLEFLVQKYIQSGYTQLFEENLPELLKLKFGSTTDANEQLGSTIEIRNIFFEFQKKLYT